MVNVLERDWYSVTEAAKILEIGRPRVYVLIKDTKRFPSVQKITKTVYLIHRSDIENYMNSPTRMKYHGRNSSCTEER